MINFSAASHTASWIHQNIKIRINKLIHTFLTGWLWTFNWIHFLKWIVVCSNIFPVFYTLWQHHKHICHFYPSCSCIHNTMKNNLSTQQLACKKGLITFYIYIYIYTLYIHIIHIHIHIYINIYIYIYIYIYMYICIRYWNFIENVSAIFLLWYILKRISKL